MRHTRPSSHIQPISIAVSTLLPRSMASFGPLAILVLLAACSSSTTPPADSSAWVDTLGPTDTGQQLDSATGVLLPPGPVSLSVGVPVPTNLGLPGALRIHVLGGRLPAGVFVNAEGRAWGRPLRDEVVSCQLEITTVGGEKVQQSWDFEVRSGRFSMLPPDNPVVPLGVQWELPLRVLAAPDGPVQWSVQRGELPAGLALAGDGVLAGVAEEPGLFPLLVQAQAGSEVAELAFVLRVGDSPILAPLAAAFEANAMQRLLPNGMALSLWPDGHYGDYGDSGMWTGTLATAMAFRAAVTGDDTILKHVLHGMTLCRLVTGVPGLTARGIEKDEWVGKTAAPNLSLDNPEVHLSTAAGLEAFRWVGDVSRDQWTGHFLGNALAWALAPDPATREEAAANMVAMALHLHQNGMEIHDVDGEVTKYGHMSGNVMDGGFPMPNGVNAIMSLGWFLAASNAAQGADAELLTHVVEKMLLPRPQGWNVFTDDRELGYIEAIEDSLYPYSGSCDTRKWFNMNITNDAFFTALLFLPDGTARQRLAARWWDEMWVDHGDTPLTRRAQSEQNPWFTFLILSGLARYDANAHFEALVQLVRFPLPPRLGQEIHNSENPEYPHDSTCPTWAFQALPVHERCSGTNFVWQRNPYELDCMGSVGQEYSGVDFLAPYWLGVSMGYVHEAL